MRLVTHTYFLLLILKLKWHLLQHPAISISLQNLRQNPRHHHHHPAMITFLLTLRRNLKHHHPAMIIFLLTLRRNLKQHLPFHHHPPMSTFLRTTSHAPIRHLFFLNIFHLHLIHQHLRTAGHSVPFLPLFPSQQLVLPGR